ncbi:unnamed protein product [Effrenium voratum]|nr:unnamed protein product [Effrenium voratum]
MSRPQGPEPSCEICDPMIGHEWRGCGLGSAAVRHEAMPEGVMRTDGACTWFMRRAKGLQLQGTLHPRSGGLPSIPSGLASAASPGWPLMGLAPRQRLRIVATLSTTPPRLRSAELKACLLSLLMQKTPVSVFLVVPQGPWQRGGAYPRTLPPWLLRLQRQWRRLRVLRSRDWGPGTALLRAVEVVKEPSAWILAVDDDHCYHPELVTNLLRFAAGTPGTAVASHGWLALDEDTASRAVAAAGPALARNIRAGNTAAGPILCHFLGLLVQRAMLHGLHAQRRVSACSEHNDIWLSAHLARRRIRRAMVSDPLGAKSLATHRKRGLSLTRRRRRKPEADCLMEFHENYGDTLWKPLPRMALCAPVLPTVLEQLAAEGQVVHSAYTCALSSKSLPPSSDVRRVPCWQPAEHSLLSQVLLQEREASTIIVLPAETFNSSRRAAVQVPRQHAKLE